jgi:hypothetical protein
MWTTYSWGFGTLGDFQEWCERVELSNGLHTVTLRVEWFDPSE